VPAANVTAGFAVTVIASGVVHQDPQEVIVSHAPPFAVFATASKAKSAPVLAMLRICGRGLEPPKGFVKAMGFTCSNTESPTTTLTGIVTLLPAATKET
jgi:hypothetical protein